MIFSVNVLTKQYISEVIATSSFAFVLYLLEVWDLESSVCFCSHIKPFFPFPSQSVSCESP